MSKPQTLVDLFAKAPMKETFGMTLSYEGEEAVFDLPYDPKFEHALSATHGGVIATLLDNAGWFTAAVQYDTWIVTTDLHVQLLSPVTGKALRARGHLVKTGRQMAFAKMEAVDEDGKVVAVGSGTFVVTDKSWN